MKTKILFFCSFIITTMFSFGQIDSTLLNLIAGVDSTYIYNKDGSKDWLYVQKDVYCFQLLGDIEYTGTYDAIIEGHNYWDLATSKFNEVHFSASSTWLERASFVETITNLPNYKRSSFALTRNAISDYSEQEYYRSDDQIMVTFNDPLLSSTAIDSFASAYGLYLVHTPSPTLPNTVSWTYIFRMQAPQGQAHDMVSLILAQEINENEPELVKLAEPNLYATYSLVCTPTTEVGLTVGGVTNSWHIRNTGGAIWSGYTGEEDADADICECWGEGYTGTGIKVGIIDFGGIEFSHDDFEGTIINEVYNATDGSIHTDDIILDPLVGHGMMVTGTVGATPNNTGLGLRWAVGAAYGAEVRPYLVAGFDEDGGTIASNAQIVTSIERAIIDGVDVVNMSFRTDAGIGTIDIQINNAVEIGRPNGEGGFYGIVFVAAGGNINGEGSNFPAKMPNVIGVGWTNPEDYRSAYDSPAPSGGGWTTNPGDGSTYGDPSINYDVVAPGELITTTNLTTVGTGDYIFASGSSLASPIVASIAAMILEKDPTLNYNVVKTRIRDGAEKVHSDIYDYNMYGGTPGYNNEMFYGRVSCINSLNSTASISEDKGLVNLAVFRQNENQYLVFIPKSTENQTYQLFDMSGRIVYNSTIGTGITQISIDLSNFTKGMYILRLNNGEKPIASTKLLK